ncbi:hypothetical protein SNEBB_005624 [Seison nebaliae]|nr:hypothetical protein SNEBB_005624 [Seison nebaliae]
MEKFSVIILLICIIISRISVSEAVKCFACDSSNDPKCSREENQVVGIADDIECTGYCIYMSNPTHNSLDFPHIHRSCLAICPADSAGYKVKCCKSNYCNGSGSLRAYSLIGVMILLIKYLIMKL